jgi:cyclopropane-fatty-acyl-phospholipid synthase
MQQPSAGHNLPLPQVGERPSFELARRRRSQQAVNELLTRAGIVVGGAHPWDLRVHDERFYDRVLSQNSLGLGESYMEGWWDCERIDELAFRILKTRIDKRLKTDWRLAVATIGAKLTNRQTPQKSTKVAKVHYDLGNAFFERMLGSSMVYSCAYWKDATTLDEAQEAKLDLICRKLDLGKGDKLLDIGCGWGGLARHAAERYGCSVTGITISERQYEYAREFCRGLPVHVLLMDYRSQDLEKLGPFDKVASVGMFEHVGAKNYLPFMRIAHRLLKDRGVFLLQTIGQHGSTVVDLWVDKYIFPNSRLPNPVEIAKATAGLFVLEDWQNIGADYDRTLMAWHRNFEAYAHSRDFSYDRKFYRMWRYYLLTFAACFRVRDRTELWQVAFSKGGVPGGVVPVR